jgi:hypothetical protein
VAPSSSAKKVARLAQRGKGKRVRFQGGTLFPAAVSIVVVIGLLLIVYARQSRPSASDSPPTINDHWHAAIGIYACDDAGPDKGQPQWQAKFAGNKEAQGIDPATGQTVFTDKLFATTGVHSHDDGVIHWHPYSSKSVGNRAKLGVFFDVYGIKMSDDELKLPADQGLDGKEQIWKEGTTKCGGEDADLRVVVWDSYSDTGAGQTYQVGFDDIRIKNDGMVFALVFAPKDAKITMPPWAAELPQLGAADGGSTGQTTTTVAGETTTTVAGDTSTTVADATTTVAGATATTTVAGAATTAPGTTVAAATTAPATTAPASSTTTR